ncbi:ABC transporter permease [Gulbenkiania mobilis]|uniref:ABC-2 type transport system permease protein/ribosome-dependent ATPase n=1 Tax=Gulbenkiania mobilis TaxID=397457 RepID=A0ABY2CWH3_GULMO|nr:ABC-2 type transport system permease protein/ribosome-dependent ATPase [Gulbenkiania mobilis]
MNFKRVAAIAYKEWREIVRDRLFFSLAFVVPALLMVLFGYGLSLDVENIPFAVVDHDKSAQSREYAYRFIGSRYFRFEGYAINETQAARLIEDGRVRVVLVLPPRFGRDLAAGQPVTMQTLVDGTFPSRAMTTKGYVTAINAAFSLGSIAQAVSQVTGLGRDAVLAQLTPVRLETRYLYNQSVASIWSLAPKLIMVILMLSPPFLTALGVVREKENGSIFNIYASSVSRGEFLLGKLAPYVAISTANILVLWTLATMLYRVPFKGDFGFFLGATLVYVLCTTGIGLLVSVLVRTQVAAMIVTMIVTMIPAVLYSGLIIPIVSLGSGARAMAHLMPAMYYTDIVVGCFLKGVGWAALWRPVAILAAYATVLYTAGYLLFSKRPRT